MPPNRLNIKQIAGLQEQLDKSLSDILNIGNTASQHLLMGTYSIGVGTASPVSTIDVVGSINSSGGAGSASGTGFKFNNRTDTGLFEHDDNLGIMSPGNIILHLDSDNSNSDDTRFSIVKNNAIVNSLNNELFRVQEDGNVGIGTSAPSSKLHIGGDLLVDTSISAQSLYVYNEQWTIELVDAQTVDFYAPYDMRVATYSVILTPTTISLYDDGVTYSIGATISIGSKITVTSATATVINLDTTH